MHLWQEFNGTRLLSFAFDAAEYCLPVKLGIPCGFYYAPAMEDYKYFGLLIAAVTGEGTDAAAQVIVPAAYYEEDNIVHSAFVSMGDIATGKHCTGYHFRLLQWTQKRVRRKSFFFRAALTTKPKQSVLFVFCTAQSPPNRASMMSP